MPRHTLARAEKPMSRLPDHGVPEWVIVDFHGVLIEPVLADLRISSLTYDPGTQDALRRLETGELTISAFLSILPPHPPARRELRLEPRPRLLVHIQNIRRRGIRVALLTNTFRGFAGIRQSAGVPDEMFDMTIESWRERVRKPDPEIFLRALNYINSDASRCLFLDDELLNVQVAAKLGFRVIHSMDEYQTLRELEDTCGVPWYEHSAHSRAW